jgi:hypothetical protein
MRPKIRPSGNNNNSYLHGLELLEGLVHLPDPVLELGGGGRETGPKGTDQLHQGGVQLPQLHLQYIE